MTARIIITEVDNGFVIERYDLGEISSVSNIPDARMIAEQPIDALWIVSEMLGVKVKLEESE